MATYVVAALALAGCEASIRGEPKPSVAPERSFSEIIINATLDEDGLVALAKSGASAPERNRVIYARLAELDHLYFTYERELARELRESNFVLSLVQLGIGGAGAIASEGASQVLSGVSAGLTGAQDAYSKDVLVDQTIQALLSQMRAGRNQVKARILRRLGRSGAQYPLQAAVSDLEAYRQAGTLTAALLGITEGATAAESAANDLLAATEGAVLSFKGRASDLTVEAQAGVIDIVAALRDPERVSDARILELANAPPTADDADFSAMLGAYGGGAAFEAPEIARIALIAAVEEMERSPAKLKAWSDALGG